MSLARCVMTLPADHNRLPHRLNHEIRGDPLSPLQPTKERQRGNCMHLVISNSVSKPSYFNDSKGNVQLHFRAAPSDSLDDRKETLRGHLLPGGRDLG